MDEPIFTGAYLTNQAHITLRIINMEDRYRVFSGETIIGTFDNFCAAVSFAQKYGACF